jgi:AAA+ superfamily predicted ATPase
MTGDHINVFELELELPDSHLKEVAKRLIGFQARYARLKTHLELLIDTEGLETWSRKFYGKRLALLDALADRYPLVIFHGDVGNGKTQMAEAMSNALAGDLKRDAMLFKLSTRVRGTGNVGEMSMLINGAFEVVTREAKKSRLSFLIIDEADSLAASRSNDQSHHEDKVAVNTLIQKIDDIRRLQGRLLVFLCTNRFESLDPAILRRAGHVEEFRRPNDQEREDLLRLDCEGLGLGPDTIRQLVALTGPQGSEGLGFTFSDIRTRLLPEALGKAFPKRKVSEEDLIEAAQAVPPTPTFDGILQ